MAEEKKDLPTIYNAEAIEEAIKTGNFESLTNNKFLKIDDKQALGVIRDLFEQVKRANPGLNEYSFSLLTLFSAVMEVWGLTQDREVYKKFQEEELPKDLKVLEKQRSFLSSDLVFKEKVLDLKTKQYEMMLSSATAFDKIDEQIEMLNDLNHKKQTVLNAEISLRNADRQIESKKTSIKLKHYNISSGGAIFTNMENNLLSKYERIGKLLDQFNLNPSAIGLTSGGDVERRSTATDGFFNLDKFAGDKKTGEPN